MEDGDPASPDSRKALLIAYYWPPAGGPGVQRWLKFAKYLQEFGWNLTVIVPSDAAYPVLDTSLAAEVPEGIDVVHTPIVEPYEAIMGLMPSKPSERLGSGGGEDGLMSRALLWLRGNVLLPDPRVLWRRRAVRQGFRAVQQAASDGTPFDAIITTGPPHSVHLIGLDLKRKTGLPWLADFRDLWREMDYLEDFLPTQRTRRRHQALEGAVVRNADTVTITSPSVEASLAIHLKPEELTKCRLVYNGYDDADMLAPDNPNPAATDSLPNTEAQGTPPFHLGHFGSLFPTRDAPGLWTAIRTWNEGAKRPVHLDLVGKISPPVLESLHTHLLPEDWTDHGYLPHQDAVRMMADMDGLLLIQNDTTTGQRAIPGKAFEYLGTGKPMATIAPLPSDLDALVTSWGCSTCGHQDAAAARHMLETLMTPHTNSAELAQRYTRRALSASMADILREMTDSSTS